MDRYNHSEEMPVTRPAEITTTQLFSRAGMGYLWNKRAELDPGQAKILNTIHNNKKKKDIETKQIVTYKLSYSKTGRRGYGRYYSSIGGLETVEKECRGTLCRDYYHDIDMVNCHPVLLEQLAKNAYNKDLPALSYYIKHREEILAMISDNRDEAKTEIIRIVYGGKNTFKHTEVFASEIRDFTQFLIQKGDYADLWDVIKNDEPEFIDGKLKFKVNKYGRFLSYVLQTAECDCMLAMKESLEKDGWSVDVLCYDGMMIRKREGVSYEESLRNAEAYIAKKTGYKVSLVEKPMDFFEVPKMEEEIVKGVSLKDYNEVKAEFERNHFYHIKTDQIGELDEKGEIFFMTKAHAKNYLGTKYIFKHSDKFGDHTSFINIWMNDPARRSIHTIDFKETDDPAVFVIPLQFAYEKVQTADPDAAQKYLDLLDILATGEQKEYLLNYLAHILQKPLENPKVAVVLTGLKGCGKDTPIDIFMEHVVGALYSKNYDSNEQFFDKHDLGRLNKFLVKLEEADPVICKKNASNLKARITANYSSFNPKGLNPFEAANYGRNFYTTNKGNPFEMSDGERRFFIMNAKANRKGDYEYWKDIRKTLFTPSAGRAIAEMLLARDISKWNPFDMPVSEYQKAVVDSEKSSEQDFVDNWDGEEATVSDLFILYKAHCAEHSLPSAQNAMSFGKRLLPLLRDGVIQKKKTKTSYVYKK